LENFKNLTSFGMFSIGGLPGALNPEAVPGLRETCGRVKESTHNISFLRIKYTARRRSRRRAESAMIAPGACGRALARVFGGWGKADGWLIRIDIRPLKISRKACKF
jgi:hypothetical protein